MNKSTLRTGVIILTLFTAVVHLVILNLDLANFSVLFALNGLGYLTLLGAFLGMYNIPGLSGAMLYYAYIAYSLVTIIAFFVMGGSGTLGYVTKTVEALLVVALYLHMKKA